MAGISQAKGTTNSGFDPNKNYKAPLIIVTALFFMWGFITCLNDILIPALKEAFDLNSVQAMLINSCFFGAFFFMAIPAGKIVEKLGYKMGIIVGLGTAAVGCFLFYPAAELKVYELFLGALFVLASGITVLQVAANPYVTLLGKPQTSSSRLTLTQAFNSLGTTLAPIFGTYAIFGAVQGKLTADAVQLPYIGLAAALAVLALFIGISKLPTVEKSEEIEENIPAGAAFKFKHLTLGVIAIFMYVGGEVAIGSLLTEFVSLDSVLGIPIKEAGYYVAFYWMGAMIGRFIGAGLLAKLNPNKILGFAAMMNVFLLLTSVLTSGMVSMISVVSIGLFNSIMFPTIFALSIRGLGRYTSQGASYLVMAIVGGAIIPIFQGYIADLFLPDGVVSHEFKNEGIKISYLLPIICYIYVAYFGFVGSKPDKSLNLDLEDNDNVEFENEVLATNKA
jgi:FHS family L-fucose permease-like MFS transporter